MFCPLCGAQYRDDVTQCGVCRVGLVAYLDESESLSDPDYLTKRGRAEGLITLIVTAVSSWITGVKMRRKIREALGRKATNLDLSSIATWTKLDELQKAHEVNKKLDSRAGGSQQNLAPTTLRYSEQEFQEIVSKVLDDLPQEFDKEWENVAVLVSTKWVTDADKKRMGVPEGNLVFGTYSGIARTKGRLNGRSRHIVVVYQPALELRCGSNRELLENEIRRVVLHELGHHLGMSHQRMREIGL